MANNNLHPTLSTSLPYYVPRIVMIATYSQSSQTVTTSTVNNFMQTDTSTFNTSATQTRPFQNTQSTQTFPQQNTQAIQTDIGLNENLTLYSTESSSSTDLFDETVSVNNCNTNRKRKSNKDLSNKRSHTKQRKQVTFTQDQQNSSELSDKTIPMSEISPILESYEKQLQTFQSSQTFGTLDTNSKSSLVQPTSYHNEVQPMTTQQKVAMAQAALINFFGEAGTVTSILKSVQPSHTQTLTELSDEQDLNVSQKGKSLPVSTSSYTIPRISHSTQSTTQTATQQNTNRQSYKVPHYYTDPYSSSDTRIVRRHKSHHHHKDRKHPRKEDRK